MTVQEASNEGQTDIGLAFNMNGGTLPSFLDVDGRKLVLISHAEYLELVAARSRLLRTALGRDAPPAPKLGLSTIERDPEVAEFLVSRFRGGVTIDQIRSACLNKFGAERTPSRSRITTFRLRLARSR